MIVFPSSTYPAQVYWSWMMTLWRMNKRHDCRVVREAFNDNRLPNARMEASVTSRPVTPNRPGGNLFGNDTPRADHRASRGYPEAENMTEGRHA